MFVINKNIQSPVSCNIFPYSIRKKEEDKSAIPHMFNSNLHKSTNAASKDLKNIYMISKCY